MGLFLTVIITAISFIFTVNTAYIIWSGIVSSSIWLVMLWNAGEKIYIDDTSRKICRANIQINKPYILCVLLSLDKDNFEQGGIVKNIREYW